MKKSALRGKDMKCNKTSNIREAFDVRGENSKAREKEDQAHPFTINSDCVIGTIFCAY